MSVGGRRKSASPRVPRRRPGLAESERRTQKLAPITELRVFYERSPAERLLVGRLAYQRGVAVFEYEAAFRALGLELSPYGLPLGDTLLRGKAELFDGLFGVFDDSLPDGWGRLLLDRHVEAVGGRRELLTPLDRLAWVGDRGVGALCYEPARPVPIEAGLIDLHALGRQTQLVLEDKATRALARLLALGGSPQGARPKALVLVSKDGAQVVAGEESREGFTPYLVKFPSKSDGASAGPVELAYSLMASAAGLNVPAARLLGAQRKHPGFFALRRFDRDGGRRLHAHTLAGLISAPPGLTATSYEDFLKVTLQLTRDARQVKEALRRAAFNLFAHNRDDHSRNFAFLMQPDGEWRLAPAYDLTFSGGPGGEHTLTFAGEGLRPTTTHLLALARVAGVAEKDAKAIIEGVRSACAKWETFADEAGVPKSERLRIGRVLAAVGR